MFWAWIAEVTSPVVSPKRLSLSGSSQIRIAYCEPNTVTSPTPSTREIGSCTVDTRKSDRSVPDNWPSSETKPTTIRKLRADLATVTPWFCTACGSSGKACWTLFWVCTWAMSGSVSASKVRVMPTLPKESVFELM